MNRTQINPWQWSLAFGFNQAELITDFQRVLVCAGQSAVNAEGVPQFPDDFNQQLSLALDNLEAVLSHAGMNLSNVVKMNIYTTDVDRLMENYGVLAERLGQAGVMPPGTLLGVSRLAFPELVVELEATAAS